MNTPETLIRKAAQIIPVRKPTQDNLEVFVGYRTTKSFNSQWCAPGGNFDPGDNALSAGVRELYEETGALVWADQLEFLRQTTIQARDRVYQVDSFLLDATEDDLKNTSPGEHSTMIWQDIGVLMRNHREKIARHITMGTVPVRLAETFALLEQNQGASLETLGRRVQSGYLTSLTEGDNAA